MFWSEFPLLKKEMEDFEDYLKDALASREPLIEGAIQSLAQAGGKRVRPALVIATAHFGEYDKQKVWQIAAAVEIMHMATLIHDDIIDESDLRRGKQTVQANYGKDVAVFTGDYLFTLTFDILSGSATNQQLQKIAETIRKICEGEIKQQEERNNLSISYKDYFRRIKSKTALLFEGSCALGAGIADLSKFNIRRAAHYGRYLGMAYQLVDDVLDFSEDSQTLGKPNNNDFTQGIYTLPILYVYNETDYDQQLQELLEEPVENHSEIKEIVNKAGGLDYTLDIAESYIKKAKDKINKLENNAYQEILIALADKVIQRNF
ncbi:polyprenyl synthetase family protein [Halanaerobacter jeridensis]|uniref:Heptaprenyl diphosphate synthase n=1 Tax=Halanaerobacter jeridensis TaxID=706427 RepID=A0A938XS88_9FIRM|nr:polyprenyl synthetase family protein [Halanaerobacter jeridensis]MBM7555889.1 heptaprenyl diphosphate synthase [Halanaerobacter jeridensis]